MIFYFLLRDVTIPLERIRPGACSTNLATRGAQRTVRRDSDGVEVPLVTPVVRLELAVGQIPHLDDAIPAAGHDDGIGVVGREANARDPMLVAILDDGILALSESVPQLKNEKKCYCF